MGARVPAVPIAALLTLDICGRTAVRCLGTRSRHGRELAAALSDVRRQVAPLILAAYAADPTDPKRDFMAILAAAATAGLSWPDMVDALNHFHERDMGR